MKSPTTTITRASCSEQRAASKTSTNTHHSRASRAEQWAAIRKGEGTNHNHLPQNFSSCERLQFPLLFKLHKEETTAQNKAFSKF